MFMVRDFGAIETVKKCRKPEKTQSKLLGKGEKS